jgi:hypothetical protein
MMRSRDPQGVYADGGCMDNTRESPRWIHSATTDISLPILSNTAANSVWLVSFYKCQTEFASRLVVSRQTVFDLLHR